MFLNKALFVYNIAEVLLIIDGIYYVVDHRLGQYRTEHDRKKLTKIKVNTMRL
jgi:hypothetical protein